MLLPFRSQQRQTATLGPSGQVTESRLQAPDTTLTPEGLTWTAERLTHLGTAIYKLIQGYTDKAIVVTSELLSWVTHFTLQVRLSLIADSFLCETLLSCKLEWLLGGS